MDRARYWLLTVMTCALVSPSIATAQEAGRPTLRLRNGGYVAGELRTSDDAESIVWQGDGFSRPLRFPLSGVHSLQYPQPAERASVIGPFGFELSGGDTLIGQLISLDDREAVLEIPPIGKVSVERSALQRFYRQGAADLIYCGPTGLEGWTTAGTENGWRDAGGHLSSDVAGAAIGRKDRPPSAVCYDITLAWSTKPSFVFTAGLSEHAAGRTAFRLETWDDQLVVTRESDKQADVAVVQKLEPAAGLVTLSVMFDEQQGRLLVYTAAGEQVADFTVPPDKNPPKPAPPKRQVIFRGMPAVAAPQPEPPTGLLLTNLRGTLTLQHLTIRRWSGIAPKSASATEATIELKQGEPQSGEILKFDAEARQLVITKAGKEQRIDEAQLQDVRFSQRDAPRQPAVSILLKNGVRLSGDLKQIGQEALVLQSPSIKQPVTLPVNDLQALVLVGSAVANEPAAAQHPRLELPGVSLRGTLNDARQAEDSSLLFQPTGSSVASPLVADVSGKLIFREAPPPAKPDPQPTVAVPPRGAVVPAPFGLSSLFGVKKSATPTVRPKPPGNCLLHLRSGDTLPCQVESIDERGVTFKSANTKATFAPHERIKALELRLDAKPVKIQKTRFERLLTLPRMQRDNPPEHLIRSLEGDYLRGRIVGMNDNVLEIEMRLEGKKIARDQITRILWLHPDESAKAAVTKPAETADPKVPAGIRVQAVPRSGNRLTFFAQELMGKTLSGQSEVLGACHVEIDQIDQLLLGAAIEETAATLAFNQWKLRPATDPLPDPDPNADPGSGEGMESVLVGKPAPAIELDLLTGGKFKLADYKDKVVVLDFWASWCGPCLQAMPQIDKVAKEFSEQGVTLIAINLEEAPDKIKTALTRLGLDTAVALDKDGRIAERYGASSIPQTVIIGRDGKVARLFVGGGTRFDERLRQALKAVLEN
ncbi:MAG: thiol-disulfide isomerase-like thioredoxin [Planctomycetaceae bacterium]|nr:thiol-disulfide isomerase-like thioredoxin [Planctomycetaceae bacterium]